MYVSLALVQPGISAATDDDFISCILRSTATARKMEEE